MITSPISSPSVAGPHSVQVLHTYGISSSPPGYSWSPVGEFTVWAAYLKAIKKACKYIYIEDQYFLPFDWPLSLRSSIGPIRNSDIIYQLGEAIKRGVRVAVLVPSNAEDTGHIYQKYQRDMGVNYLNRIAIDTTGDFIIASLHNGTSPIYVHSKLMICDDEYVAIGSANICQRSMTHDSELHVGIVDSDNKFAKEFRKKLWSEHLNRSEATLDDPIVAYQLFKADTKSGGGGCRVRLYIPIPEGSDPPFGHSTVITTIIDPYGGPPR
jgi:phosphatidylserine/phosphatidylglycerophosphate/cardiolipin synthase-like enzyme